MSWEILDNRQFIGYYIAIWQDKEMAKRDFDEYHPFEVLRGAVAEIDGNEDLSRRLHAETKLRLISMSDEELWRLAKLTPSLPVFNQIFILFTPFFTFPCYLE